jgi:carbon-monoxide dehydrogenase medium subunit
MRHGEALPAYLIDIRGIPALDYILFDEKEGLKIGALTTIHSVATSPIVREKYALLAEAASQLGTHQVRNRATIGGNLSNAAPSAETAPPLIVLGARARVTDGQSDRTVLLEGFFAGLGQTILKPGEILTELQVKPSSPHSGGVYLKHTLRKSLDLAIVGVAVMLTMSGGFCADIKISLGAVAPAPVRAVKAEEFVRGKKIEGDIPEKAGQIAVSEASPIDDTRSSASYRRKMIGVLVKRGIRQAVERATSG